jgi:hypothetical protein
VNVLIIGNSHVAAIKTGWDSLNGALASKITPTFAAAKGRGLSTFKRTGTVFKPSTHLCQNELRFTSGGLDHIDVNNYSMIVTVGLYLGRYRLVENLSRHRTEERLPQELPRHIVSEEVERLTIENAIHGCFCVQFIRRLREATELPILAMEQPMPRQAALFESKRKGRWKFAKKLNRTINEIWASETEKLERSHNIHVLNQPESTLTGARLTSDEFGIGSARLAEGFSEAHRTNEYFHMNARYGEIVLRDLADKLQSITSRPPNVS